MFTQGITATSTPSTDSALLQFPAILASKFPLYLILVDWLLEY